MRCQEAGEAIVRIIDDEPTVSVQVSWRGAEFNLLRTREELVERFVQRLGISCGKHHCAGGERKKTKKEKKKGVVGDGSGKRPEVSAGVAVSIISKDGTRISDAVPVVEALQKAAHIEIEGEHLPIRLNPPAIKKLEVFGRALAGCPLVAAMRCEFCTPSSFQLKWLYQVQAGAMSPSQCLGEGRVLWLPEASGGKILTLRAEARGANENGPAAGIVRIGLVDEIPRSWPERRLEEFGVRSQPEHGRHRIRVVSFNILAAPYARTKTATGDMYPYCPAHALDYVYRQPLVGRELARLDADIVCLQECSYSTCCKFLSPLFGEKYHIRVTLKANAMSEGCVMLLRKDAFEVLEERDFLFKELLQTSSVFKQTLREVKQKWPEFVSGVLPHMSTVFQISVVRHKASGAVIVVSNTHLFFHPRARHIRLLQAMCLLQQVHELRDKHRSEGNSPRLLLCGDMNCTPDQAVVQLFLRGEVGSNHPDWDHAAEFRWQKGDEECMPADEFEEDGGEDMSAITKTDYTAEPSADPQAACDEAASEELVPQTETRHSSGMGLTLTNPLGPLIDVYASEPLPFTNYVNDFHGTLDYILTCSGLTSVNRLPGVSEEELRPEGVQGGLPCELYPSDHLSIAADVELAVD
jgi:2',5'-phosphodiesterase